MLREATIAPRRAGPLSAAHGLRSLSEYDLLLCGLLGLTAAARLWLVPGYFRADSWLALVAGRDVSSSGIPHHESLTSVSAGSRWIDQQWLAHLLTYDLYRIGGLALIATLSVLLATGAFSAMAIAARLLDARARTVLVLMPMTLFPFFALSWQPRTQSFAYPLFAAVFLILLRDTRWPSSRVLLVLPLLALWGNLHGSAVLGAALVMLRGCVLPLERQGRAPALSLALTALPPVVLLATPYGLTTADYYRATLLEPSFKRLATEWQPVTHDPVLLVPFALLAILVASTLLFARSRTTLWERLALVLLVAGAATAIRNMVWLTLGALPVLALAIDRIIPADPPARRSAARVNCVLAVLAGVAVATTLIVTARRPTADFERGHPAAYLQAVRHAAALDPAARVVADVGDADWLLWHDDALRGRIAFDARLELLSAAHIQDIASLLEGSGASRLRNGSYRIFALDQRAAAATIKQLLAEPGRRILFADGRRIVILLARA